MIQENITNEQPNQTLQIPSQDQNKLLSPTMKPIKIPRKSILQTTPEVQQEDQDKNQNDQGEQVKSALASKSKLIMKKQFNAVLQGQKISRFLTQQRDILINDLETLEGDALIEEVIILLKKNWNSRTYRDNRVITKCVADLNFFKSHFGKNHEKMITKCAQYFKYHFCQRGEKVFEQGESGDKFFVILKGRVSIHVDFKRQDVSNSENNTKQEDETVQRVHIRDLEDGDSFGELALIDKKPRGATITCIDDCHFITFDKQSFDKIIKHQQIKKFKEELMKLKKNYLFSHFSGNSLKTIYLLFQVLTFNKGDEIIKENQPSDQIYIIREGEFKVSRTAYIKIEADASFQLNKNQKKKDNIVVDSKTHNNCLILISMQLGILGPNQSFGEEEFFTKETRKVNVVCLSRKGEVF